jgi:hypothetical protein
MTQTARKPEGHSDAQKFSKYYYRVTKHLQLLRILIQLKQFSQSDPLSALPCVPGFQVVSCLQIFRIKYEQIGEKYCGINACDSVYIAPFVS